MESRLIQKVQSKLLGSFHSFNVRDMKFKFDMSKEKKGINQKVRKEEHAKWAPMGMVANVVGL